MTSAFVHAVSTVDIFVVLKAFLEVFLNKNRKKTRQALQERAMSNGNRIYLGRLPYGTRERDIDRFLKGYGRVREINLKNGFGFVVS